MKAGSTHCIRAPILGYRLVLKRDREGTKCEPLSGTLPDDEVPVPSAEKRG